MTEVGFLEFKNSGLQQNFWKGGKKKQSGEERLIVIGTITSVNRILSYVVTIMPSLIYQFVLQIGNLSRAPFGFFWVLFDTSSWGKKTKKKTKPAVFIANIQGCFTQKNLTFRIHKSKLYYFASASATVMSLQAWTCFQLDRNQWQSKNTSGLMEHSSERKIRFSSECMWLAQPLSLLSFPFHTQTHTRTDSHTRTHARM